MLVNRPDLVRVRLELARAFFLKGEDGLAKEHFERVLAGNPPAGVALNVNRFLAQIRARKRWSVRVGAALAPDSNVTARSGERTILLDTQFGRLPFTYQGDKPRSGIGIALWAGGEYQYPVNPRWRLRAGGDVSRQGIPRARVRPDDALRPSRPAMADRPRLRGQPARQRPPQLARRPRRISGT